MNRAAMLARDGLWTNNPGWVQLLGLGPLLAVSNTLVTGFALGLATLLVLTLSSIAISAARRWLRPQIRAGACIIVIATLVTIVELLMQAYLHALHQTLGIFVPLIAIHCIAIGRAEKYAVHNPVRLAACDGFSMGLGFALALVTLAALRELLAQGTLFAGAHLLFGESMRGVQLSVLPEFQGLLLAALPPGAFIGLGLLIAAKNRIDARFPRPASTVSEAADST